MRKQQFLFCLAPMLRICLIIIHTYLLTCAIESELQIYHYLSLSLTRCLMCSIPISFSFLNELMSNCWPGWHCEIRQNALKITGYRWEKMMQRIDIRVLEKSYCTFILLQTRRLYRHHRDQGKVPL